MMFLARLGQSNPISLRFAEAFIWRQLHWLVPFVCRVGLLRWLRGRDGIEDKKTARITNLFAIGRDNANDTIKLRGDHIDIEWNYADENHLLIERMQQAMGDVARVYGDTFASLFSWIVFRRILTVHSLGGCHLSETPDRGVVSPEGEVHGYRGLFVGDGSVIPTSIGFHPCMTIAAVAECIAHGIATQSVR